MLKPIGIDFETAAIQNRPHHPPKPVGFSIKWPHEKRSRYLAWGHPTGNNCTFKDAQIALQDAWDSDLPLVFHNAKFDYDVAIVHMGMHELPWERIHDTMFMIYLVDPHAATFALKPSSERILGIAPTERDAVNDWILANVPGAKKSNVGAFICEAPGDLVGRYADGDVTRTLKLFKKLHPQIKREGMLAAYDRERELLPILLTNETEGVRADLLGLKRDEALFTSALLRSDAWIAKRLKAKDLDFNNDVDVAEALEKSGMVVDFVMTKTGKRSVSKDNLTPDMFKDKRVAQAFAYRNKVSTCLTTFFRPWISMAEEGNGRLHTNWNQVRQSRGRNSAGTRTGRLSSNNPNFQNVPKTFDDKNDGYIFPEWLEVPELPAMRRYILPDKGQVFCHRDYNQQELRILAHFEDDAMLAAYKANPQLDFHTFVQGEIERISGLHLERRAVKILNFGMVYGMGLGALANDLGVSVDEAKEIKNAQRAAIPNLVGLEREIRRMGGSGECVTTWGGRRYFSEPPQIIDGKTRTFEYKLLNYLIQGSAADCTKQAVINYNKAKKHGRFLCTVHDEINISVPKSAVKEEMAILRDAMADVAFDIPMISDGKFGPNWADLKKEK